MARKGFKALVNIFGAVFYIINFVGGEFCKIPTRLELVFLVDNSDEYPVQKIKDIVTIADDLQIKYPGSKFGLALYSDFECTAWSLEKECAAVKFHHSDPNACYTFEEALTTELGKIKERVSENIQVKWSNYTEAGVNGLLMTGAETKMGWTRGMDKGGLVRLIVVVTDDATHDGGPKYGTLSGKPRKPVKGDGTDKCETMKGATTMDANKVLARDQISVYVLVQAKMQSMWNAWREKMGSMMDVRYRIQSLDDSKNEILQKMGMFIDQLSGDVGKVDCNQCCTVL